VLGGTAGFLGASGTRDELERVVRPHSVALMKPREMLWVVVKATWDVSQG